MSRRFALAVLVAFAVAGVASGCDDDSSGEADGGRSQEPTQAPVSPQPTGERSFAMGFSYVPAERSAEGFERAFANAGEQGELILIQRPPSWSSFIGGGSPETAVLDTAQNEIALAEEHGLDFFLALDPTDPRDRGEMLDLPPELAGQDFRDAEIREAYLANVAYLAETYQPAYMALAVEMNLVFDRDPENYEAFLDVYAEGYEIVKGVSPETLVFVTFQYEELLGLPPLGGGHEPHWDLVDDFSDLDLFAVSTYPSFSFESTAQIPDDYYAQARQHTGLPMAIAEAGFNSSGDQTVAGSEEGQRQFVERILAGADSLDLAFVVWYLSVDPSYELRPPFDSLSSIGLIRPDGSEKPAWASWVSAASRGYRPADEGEATVSDGEENGETPTATPGTSGTTPTPDAP